MMKKFVVKMVVVVLGLSLILSLAGLISVTGVDETYVSGEPVTSIGVNAVIKEFPKTAEVVKDEVNDVEDVEEEDTDVVGDTSGNSSSSSSKKNSSSKNSSKSSSNKSSSSSSSESTIVVKNDLPVQDETVRVNPLDAVPSGGVVSIDDVEIKHPSNFDFGLRYEDALTIYNALMDCLASGNTEKFSVSLNPSNYTCYAYWDSFMKTMKTTVLKECSVEFVGGSVNTKDGVVNKVESYFRKDIDYTSWIEPEVNALKAAGVVDGMSHKEAIIKIDKYIRDNFSYELVSSLDSYRFFKADTGKCIHCAYAFMHLCRRAGIECQYVGGENAKDPNSAGHAWNRVLLNGNWYLVDVTWNDSSNSTKYLLLASSPAHESNYCNIYYK